MTDGRFPRTLLALVLILPALCGCSKPREPEPDQVVLNETSEPASNWNPADPTYIPYEVSSLTISESNRFAGIKVITQDGADIVTMIVDLKTGQHRQLSNEPSNLIPIPGGDRFLFFTDWAPNDEPIQLVDGLEIVDSFDIGQHTSGWWNPQAQSAVFATHWPNDREGFDAVTFLNISTGEIKSARLRQATERLALCPATGHFFTEFFSDEKTGSPDEGIDEYDGDGRFIRSVKSSLGVFSAGCKYALPFSAIPNHGPEDWGVFDANTGAMLAEFVWKEEAGEYRWFSAWNPKLDHLLLMESYKTGMETLDVFDVTQGRAIKRFSVATGSAAGTWTSDGASVVTVRDKHIVFEPLPPK